MEDYVSFEQAVKLKKLGFNWDCYNFYNPDKSLGEYTSIGYGADCRDWNNEFNEELTSAVASASTMSQAQKWLREKGYHIQITPNMTWRGWRILLYIKNGSTDIYDSFEGYKFDSYEKALSAGIDLALKFIKEK